MKRERAGSGKKYMMKIFNALGGVRIEWES